MSDQIRYMKSELGRLQEENKALKEEVVSLRHYLTALDQVMLAIEEMSPNVEIMPLLGRILQRAIRVIDAEDGSLLVLDEETGELEFVLTHGQVPEQNLIGVRIPPGKGIAGWVAHHKKPVVAHNAPSDHRFYSGIDSSLQYNTHSILAVPIMAHGRVLGVIEALNKRDGALFNETDQVLLSLLCRFAGDVLLRIVEREEGSRTAEAEPVVPSTSDTPPA